MEQLQSIDHHSNVDTSRPFRSVKEAVEIFGERFLVGDVYSPKPFSFPKKETPFFSPSSKVEMETSSSRYSSPSPMSSSYSQEPALADTVKKLEVQLEETKTQLELLKDRESETEVALASLNAELHMSMARVAQAEAAVAAKAAASVGAHIEEEKKRDLIAPSLAKVLNVGEKESLFFGRKKDRKKKPIIPLVGDLFSRKKSSSSTLHNPLYASSSSPLQFN